MKRIAVVHMFALCLLVAGCSSTNSGSSGMDGSVNGDGSASGTGGTSSSSGGSNSGSGGTVNSGTGGANSGTGATVDTVTGGQLGDAAVVTTVALCNGVPCQCSDGIDNDGDGTIDGFDAECTGPYDNDESSFATGIPGDNMDPKWQDCFFDGNSGAGDDGCKYSTDCYTGAKLPTDPACQVTQQCIDFCQPMTPNGCDCFGCCTVKDADGKDWSIVLTADCNDSDLSACIQCTPNFDTCGNTCGECELCPGKTLADLPSSCFPPSGTGGSMFNS